MNLPNKLSVLRTLLSVIMIILLYTLKSVMIGAFDLKYIILGIIFVLGSITDYLDGKIARKNNLITNFGKFIDPLADKVLVLTALVIMVEIGKIPAWIPVIVLMREFAVSGYRLVMASSKGEVIAASKWGKIKTSTQMFAITILMIFPGNFCEFIRTKNIAGNNNLVLLTLNIIGSILMIISVIATIFSGYDYLKNGKELLKDA